MIIFLPAVILGGLLSALPFLHPILVQNIWWVLQVQVQQMVLRLHIMNCMPGVCWYWVG